MTGVKAWIKGGKGVTKKKRRTAYCVPPASFMWVVLDSNQ